LLFWAINQDHTQRKGNWSEIADEKSIKNMKKSVPSDSISRSMHTEYIQIDMYRERGFRI
jgi:hypothetical protein